MARQTAVQRERIKELLHDGYVLVLVRGWYWLVKEHNVPIKANCNSAKSVTADKDYILDEWKIQCWTGR